MTLKKIEVTNVFCIDELRERLRKVKLKGFPDVEIYKEGSIGVKIVNPVDVQLDLFTPQPTVYQTYMERIRAMAKLFKEQGINIFNLYGGADYTAFDENGQATSWTIIPPVVEWIKINYTGKGLDYSGLVSPELKKAMEEKGHRLNPELDTLYFKEFINLGKDEKIPIICDGSHRIHTGVADGIEQKVLMVQPKEGYPYYAAPKPYRVVEVLPDRPEGGSTGKVHVLTEPGHKILYRLFPTGGILSGDVRPDKPKAN